MFGRPSDFLANCSLTRPRICAEPVIVDVAGEASVSVMVDTLLSRWGGVDILVNDAGFESSKAVLDIGLEEYERVMRVNTTGVWLRCRAVIPVMLRRQSGCIVNVGSVAGQRGGGLPGTAAYSTSKGAAIALTKALGREFAKSGIRVNAVSLSLTMAVGRMPFRAPEARKPPSTGMAMPVTYAAASEAR